MNNSSVINSSLNQRASTLKIIIIVVVLVVVLYLVYAFIRNYNRTMDMSPYFVHGLRSGNTPKVIKSNLVPDSNDGRYGSEFTYCMWLNISDSNFDNTKNATNKFKCIFLKGSDDYYVASSMKTSSNDNEIHYPLLQAPGLWLDPTTNKLKLDMNTYNDIKHVCEVGNIPINKWVHLTIMLIGKYIDIYINGELKKRCRLNGLPRLNYGNLYINSFGGFDGQMSDFRYFNKAIEQYQIEMIFNRGPNMVPDKQQQEAGVDINYLAPNYWFETGFSHNAPPSSSVQLS